MRCQAIPRRTFWPKPRPFKNHTKKQIQGTADTPQNSAQIQPMQVRLRSSGHNPWEPLCISSILYPTKKAQKIGYLTQLGLSGLHLRSELQIGLGQVQFGQLQVPFCLGFVLGLPTYNLGWAWVEPILIATCPSCILFLYKFSNCSSNN